MCGRIMFGYVRIILGSCSDRFRIVNGYSTVFRACVVDSDLQLQDRSLTVNGIASGAGGGVADGVLEEVSHEMHF